MYTYKTEILAFFAWALVMIFEILGARIFWPYIGNSLFVWTSIIAVVLGALASWYYHGWVVADKWVWDHYIWRLFLISWVSFLVLYVIKDPILVTLSSSIWDIRFSSFLLSLLLLSPSSYVLGMIPPILIKNSLANLETWGHTIGRLGSIGTIGSIAGTLWAGFFLLPFFWVNTLILMLALFCIFLSLYISPRKDIYLSIIFIILTFFAYLYEYQVEQRLRAQNIFTYNSPYSRIEVIDGETIWWQKVRRLLVDNINHAGKYLDSDELIFPYTRYYDLFSILHPQAKNVVMLWGAAYSTPQHFLKKYPDKYIDVVEIDPKMTEIAKTHFWLKEDPRLKIIHQDGRVFLNQNTKKYDAILWDAFGSFFSVPYQLTTLETVEKKYETLTGDGVVILNIIWSLQGKKSQFIQAEYNTYKAIFPEVFLIPVTDKYDTSIVQNIILVAMKNPSILQTLDPEKIPSELRWYLTKKVYLPKNNTPLLTDNFAPVDYYIKELAR